MLGYIRQSKCADVASQLGMRISNMDNVQTFAKSEKTDFI